MGNGTCSITALHTAANFRATCAWKPFILMKTAIFPRWCRPRRVQTSQGAGAPIAASNTLPAHLACELVGNVRIAGDAESAHVLALTEIHNGDAATYRYLDFGGETGFEIVMKADASCRVELYLDGKYHTDFKVAASQGFATFRAQIPPIHGTHALTIKLFGRFDGAAVDAFRFF